MRRIGMGLVGPGFVAAHHIDAVRRLGFVDVVAIAGGDAARARARAAELNVARVYDTVDELVADPDIHVVHNTTPNHLHGSVIRAAIARGKHVVSEKPLAVSAAEAHALWLAAQQAGVVHAVTFNYRGNPLVQQAREMIAAGEIGRPHFVHGAYLQDWLLKPTDFSWRLEPEKGGASSAFADIGSHWCDLAQHVTGQRIVAVLADCATVVPMRRRPATSRAAFSDGSLAPSEVEGTADGDDYAVTSEDLATILVRFDGGARGAVSIGQVCAGHKNDLWLEVNGSTTSLRWRQEQQNELWIGRRDEANMTLAKDPALLGPAAARYAHLPGGHQEAWADAFANVMRDIYGSIINPRNPRPPAMATFEDGYRVACLVDAVLESHAQGGVWTPVRVAEMVGGPPMKLGVFTPVFAGLDTAVMLKKVKAFNGIDALELGTGGWPGSNHLDVDRLKEPCHLKEYRQLIADHGLSISALSCHSNPLHPDPSVAKAADDVFRQTVCLAERLEVPVVVTFSGCPGDADGAAHPNWITTPWPPEFLDVLDWQWDQKAIPYWTDAGRFASNHGVKIALEPHPGFLVYNVETALRLRAATDPAVGVNFDPSHLYWQGVDIPSAIAALGPAIFHVHAKDVTLDRRNVDVNGVIDAKSYRRMAERSWMFRSVGWGHDALEWKRIVSALRLAGYDHVVSIEHEDALASVDEGLRAAVDLLSPIVLRDPPVDPWWT